MKILERLLPSILTTLLATPIFAQQNRPQVEVMFVLDTTGSMGGMLEGAKQKIWSISAAILQGQPTPQVRVGLIGYRDTNDEYVTRIFDLTENIDDIYENLQAFDANGGGDEPEHVNRALDEAITKNSWSTGSQKTLNIYLVGDAPPHMDYRDGYHYRESISVAKKRGIIINTIQCGYNEETIPFWKEMAELGKGRYVRIAQSGNMAVLETPYDTELAELNDRYSATFIPYGREGEEKRERIARSDASISSESKASKASYQALRKGGYFGHSDLLNALENKKVNLERLKNEDLPPTLQQMNRKELQSYLQKKRFERESIQKEILELGKKRDEYIRNETRKFKGKSLDGEMMEMLKEQGKEKGIDYK
jgi:Mg-chelatase subunit ChlD